MLTRVEDYLFLLENLDIKKGGIKDKSENLDKKQKEKIQGLNIMLY